MINKNTENYLTAVTDEIARDCVSENKAVKMRSAEFAALANKVGQSAGYDYAVTASEIDTFLSGHVGKTWCPGFEQVFISKETGRVGDGSQTFTEYVLTPVED